MALKVNILLVIGLLAFIRNINIVDGQDLDARFIVNLGHFEHPFLNETVIQCAGTLISVQHILCTASCVTVQSPTRIAVNVRFIEFVPPNGTITTSIYLYADKVIIHPFYDNNQYTNNAALVLTDIFRFNPQLDFVPRQLGGFSSTTNSCNLFGWGGALIDPQRDPVIIESPADCDINNPQNYCSVFNATDHPTCSALEGSPLTCGNDMIVEGFVTNNAGCSTHDSVSARLNYHSLRDFRYWIEGVVGPEEQPVREEVNFIVTVMERNVVEGNVVSIPRCFGTIISSNSVLTTGTCATIDFISRLEVQTRIVQGSQSQSVNIRVVRVDLHPSFRLDNPFENNVAILSINGWFNQRIVPRTLGSLEQNSTCQLFGWGPTSIGFTRDDPITVSRPQECNSTHSQAFCSSHTSLFHYSCSAMSGSPVICGGNDGVVAGFLINNATCSSDNNRVTLSYHSVNDFDDWILDLIGSGGVTTTISPAIFLFVVLISCVAL